MGTAVIDLFDGPRDARALLRMHTKGARVVVGLYLLAVGFITVTVRAGASPVWLLAVSWIVIACSASALLSVPGDPLPIPAAIAMAASGPVACAINLAAFPYPLHYTLQDVTHGFGTAVFCFMCVRGRTLYAWAGLCGNLLVYAVWSTVNGDGPLPGLFNVIIDVGPLAMATVFALTLRPTAKAVFDLRDAGARQAAQLAAQTAVATERDSQLAELDKLARPMLDRIASGAELSASERVTCELLEAHLRDRLRAPGLVTPDVADAVRAARSRGIEVILIDDGRADPMDGPALGRIHTHVIDTLTATRSGDVRVRLLPPNRTAAASIYVRDAESVFRREFDRAGDEVDIASVMVGD